MSEASVRQAQTEAVTIEGISKRFGRTLALDSVSFDIRNRELFAILGPNGAGKSTLILILCTLLRPDTGIAAVHGIDIVRQPRRARRQLGVVFQEPSLDTRLTVEENLEFHGRVFQVPADLRRKRMAELLDLVELGNARKRLVRTLSTGMRRRVEIARALMHDSKVVILDEPTVGLDAQSRSRMWDYLRRLQNEREVTLIVTTHYIEEVDACDRVCIIDHGKVLALDTPETLKARYGEQSIRIVPRDGQAAEAIRRRFPGAVAAPDGSMVIATRDSTAGEALLAEFGQRLRSISFERSSLESVFLNLTGRDIRDHPGNATDVPEGRRPGEEPRM
jgi:ABC-2 type transport system ATP-binding protein